MNKISLTLSHKRLPKAKNKKDKIMFSKAVIDLQPHPPTTWNIKHEPLPLEELVQKKTCVAENFIMKTIQLVR